VLGLSGPADVGSNRNQFLAALRNPSVQSNERRRVLPNNGKRGDSGHSGCPKSLITTPDHSLR
jgi:hypothetical protein